MGKKAEKAGKAKRPAARRIEEFLPPYWNRPMWWGVSPVPDLMAPLQVRAPKVNLLDLGVDLLVEAELPGVTRKGVNITGVDNTLTIRAAPAKEEPKDAEYFYREVGRGEYHRTLLLPCAVDWDQADASICDGWLGVRCPKIMTASGEPVCRNVPVD
jgi:HSP20 family protein